MTYQGLMGGIPTINPYGSIWMVDSHPPIPTRHPKTVTSVIAQELQQPPQCQDFPEACGRSWSSSPGLGHVDHDAMYRLTTMVTNGSENFRKASPNGHDMNFVVATDYSIFFGVCDSFYSSCDMNMGLSQNGGFTPIRRSFKSRESDQPCDFGGPIFETTLYQMAMNRKEWRWSSKNGCLVQQKWCWSSQKTAVRSLGWRYGTKKTESLKRDQNLQVPGPWNSCGFVLVRVQFLGACPIFKHHETPHVATTSAVQLGHQWQCSLW